MRIYNKLLGYYLPSFFFIKLNTKEGIEDLNHVNSSTLSTFFHEYTHFIQDFATIWGIAVKLRDYLP